MSSMVLALSGALIIGGALFYLVYSTLSAAEQLAAEQRLGLSLDERKGEKKFPFYIKLTSPLLREPYINMGTQFWSPERLERVRKNSSPRV